MTDTQRDLITRLVLAWSEASQRLGIRVRAPFSETVHGESFEAVAYLPDFGSQNGMVIGATFGASEPTDWRLSKYAKERRMFCSFLSAAGYANYEAEKYREALDDWGFFGPLERCPDWYGGYNHTQIALTHRALVEACKEASRHLGFRMFANTQPALKDRSTFIAFLPDFGGRAGMILGAKYPPGFDHDRAVEEAAMASGSVCFFLNGPDYVPYQKIKWKELLVERGYFGPPENLPGWLTEKPGRDKET